MTDIRLSSRRLLVVILLFMAILLVVVKYAGYLAIESVDQKISTLIKTASTLPEAKSLACQISMFLYDMKFYVIPLSAAALCVFGFLSWLFFRTFFSTQPHPPVRPNEKGKSRDARKEPENGDRKKYQDRRLFLYWLSLLQREGRFLDFLSEDLEPYEDAQIGAAVRSVHANCRKALHKKLSLAPIIDKDEGQEITVDSGFDPGSIVLTGNVTGTPPFRGILRHKGWQAKRVEIPIFSESAETSVIAPAEVEIAS